MNYWEECIAEAFEDVGITATAKQIDTVASWVESAHQNYGQAHGHNCIPNPNLEEISNLQKELKRERDKVSCNTCGGRGRIHTPGPCHSSNSQCWKCNGEGRISL